MSGPSGPSGEGACLTRWAALVLVGILLWLLIGLGIRTALGWRWDG